MATSEARRTANRANALKSTGPTSIAGKARSRTNALKHGLTGESVAIPGEDLAAIEHRFAAIEQELNPQGELARVLAHRVAALSVRLERSVRHESAFLAEKIRHAAERFDHDRVDSANELMAALDGDPAGVRQQLERTPEGCDRLVEALGALRRDLMNGGAVGDGDPSGSLWSEPHGRKLDNYLGHDSASLTRSRGSDLTRALAGSIDLLSSAETAILNPQDLRAWARDHLAELIDAEVTLLEAHRDSLDHDAIDADRLEAGTRALFDTSPAAILARKYEATTERQLFRTLREFHEAQAS